MSQRENVILVHGLWNRGPEVAVLRNRLAGAGFAARTFSYPSFAADVAENAARLNEFIRATDAGVVHLVGHSLGGIVLMKLMAEYPQQPRGRLVCLGAPLIGCASARNLADWPWGRWAMGKSGREELLYGGDDTRWDGRRDLGVIAGTVALGFGRLVGRLPQPNDGTVTVAETRLPGATDHIVLPVTHTTMLFSAEVARQIAHFLRQGRFTRVA